MKNAILNAKPVDVFVIIAETLEKWQNPGTPEGNLVLMEHHNWGSELKAKNKLLLAGPVDVELTSIGLINPIGHATGLIILNVDSRKEAIAWAEKDPFHIRGLRKNVVHSLKITMTENSVFETLQKINRQ